MQRPSPRSLFRPSARSTAGRLVGPDADPGGAGRRPMSGRTCRGSRCTISTSRSTVGPATSASDEGTDADDRTIVTCSRRCRAQGLQNRAAGARPDRGDGAGPRAHAVRNHCRQIAQAPGKPDPWASASTSFSLSSPRPARRPALKRDPCAKSELAFGQAAARPVGPPRGSRRPRRDGAASPAVGHRAAASGRARAHDRGEGLPGRGEPRLAALAARRQRGHAVLPVVDRAGKRPARDITFPGRGGVLVRAVRHHDDDGRLDAGVLDDYLPFSQHEIIVQSGPTQSTRRLHMEMGTPTPSSPLSSRNQGHHSLTKPGVRTELRSRPARRRIQEALPTSHGPHR